MKHVLGKTERECLVAIAHLTDVHSYAPTYSELAEQLGMEGDGATFKASRLVAKLIGFGFAERLKGSGRSLRLTKKGLAQL